MVSQILVTGGTGTLGREVVRLASDAGHAVRVASRHPRPPGRSAPPGWAVVDYRDGSGIADATTGIDVIVHCAKDPWHEEDQVRSLVVHTRRPVHLVYISIVGIDAMPMPYYRHKLAAEQVVEDSGLAWTILRATQFHDLVHSALRALARSPVMLLPAGASLQPVAVSEVAARLVAVAGADPAGRMPDLGGPEVLPAEELARQYLAATGRSRRIRSVPVPGAFGRALASGAATTPEHAAGGQTFAQFLAERRG